MFDRSSLRQTTSGPQTHRTPSLRWLEGTPAPRSGKATSGPASEFPRSAVRPRRRGLCQRPLLSRRRRRAACNGRTAPGHPGGDRLTTRMRVHHPLSPTSAEHARHHLDDRHAGSSLSVRQTATGAPSTRGDRPLPRRLALIAGRRREPGNQRGLQEGVDSGDLAVLDFEHADPVRDQLTVFAH